MATPTPTNVDGVDSATLLTALKAFQRGDFSVRLPMNWVGMAGKIADTFNDIAEMNERLCSELNRLNRVVGTWKDLTDSVNSMAGNLTGQVRNIADVTTAVANGDLSKKITVDVKGE